MTSDCSNAMERSPLGKVSRARVVEIRSHSDERGQLSIIEAGNEIPFPAKRVYTLFNVSPGAERGSHAHKELRQFLFSLGGAVEVVIDDGTVRQSFVLDRPTMGLLLEPGLWRDLKNFTSGAALVVLASELYDEGDYIRDYRDFIAFTKN